MIEVLTSILAWVLHLDVHLNDLVVAFGPWFYGLLFLVVFCETGLVVTPFLPGDSLLFAIGALAALDGSPLSIPLLATTFFIAALLGDVTNYTIGFRLGPKLFQKTGSRLLNRKYLDQTQMFYERHGGKTIILARFIPIVRTFAPFVAGLGQMRFRRFAVFSIVGATLWIAPFLAGGFYFGNSPLVKTNFHIVIVVVVLISLAPAIVQVIKTKLRASQTSGDQKSEVGSSTRASGM